MTVVLGTQATLLNPTTSYVRSVKPIGASRRALDGTLVSFYSALKWTWAVKWSGVSSSDRDLIIAELDTLAHIAWTPVEGTAYTVRVMSGKWSPTPGGESCYDVECELEQQ